MNPSSTSSSSPSARGPGRFALRILLFCVPVVSVLLAGQAVLYRLSDGWSMDAVVETEWRKRQSGEDTLFGRMLVAEEMRRYRLKNILRRRPKVLILGSSTVMQFRAQMFGGHAAEVYNAGGLTQQPEHLVQLVSVLEEAGVERVLLGLDFWWFNSNWQTYRLPSIDALLTRSDAKQDMQARLYAFRSFGKTVAREGSRLRLATEIHAAGEKPGGYFPIGLLAQLGDGFRGSDGSRRSAEQIERAREGAAYLDGMETLERIEKRKQQFVTGTEPSPHAMTLLKDFIEACRRAEIGVAVVLPPLARETYAAMMKSGDHAAPLRSFVERVSGLLNDERVPYLVATDIRKLGLEEENMLDGVHGSEVAMAEVFLALLGQPGSMDLFPRATPAELRRTLDGESTSDREVRAWLP